VQNLNMQSFITDKFLEENNSSHYMEMSIILNKYEKKTNKNLNKPKESLDSPLYNLQKKHCASHYDQNIFKELLYDNDLSLNNREESKKGSDFESLNKVKTYQSCHYGRTLHHYEIKNNSCMPEIHISKDRFSKIKMLYQKKMIREFFENELKKENNLLFWLRAEFIKIYLKDYNNKRKILESFKVKSNDQLSHDLSVLIKDLNFFFKIYSETIVKYYDLQRVDMPLIITKEGILEIVISLSFEEHPRLFKFLFMYQKKIEMNIEHQIDLNRKKCCEWKPEDFGVSEKYSLTSRTLEHFSRKKLRNDSDPSLGKLNESMKRENDQEMVFLSLLEEYPDSNMEDDVKEEEMNDGEDFEKEEISKVFKNTYANLIKHTVSLSKSCTSQKPFEHQSFNQRPYQRVIKRLDEIAHLKNPIQIIFKIMEVSIEILASIKCFYEMAGEAFSGTIESDEIMAIFIYLSAQSEYSLLYSKCCMIQNFIAPKKASSIYGYYLTTLIASLSCLSDTHFYSRVSRKHSKKHFLNSLRKFSSKCEDN